MFLLPSGFAKLAILDIMSRLSFLFLVGLAKMVGEPPLSIPERQKTYLREI